MARRLEEIIRLTGTLETTAPLSIGGSQDSDLTDSPFVLDGTLRPLLPGTSLAGALRSHLGRHDHPAGLWDTIWGNASKDEAVARASHLIFRDCPLIGEVALVVRDGVGIDRSEGRAVPKIKYDREVLPVGSRFAFCVEAEIPSDDLELAGLIRAELAAIRAALVSGSLALGAATTRGFGTLRLVEAKLGRVPLTSKADFLRYLTLGEPLDAANLPETEVPGGLISIVLDWAPVGPILVRAREAGTGVDALPFVSRRGGELYQTIPGSSLKGVWRTVAERLMRTLRSPPDPEGTGAARFLAALDQCDPLVHALFGRARGGGKAKPAVNAKGALVFADVVSMKSLTPEAWQRLSLEAANEAEVQTALHGTPWQKGMAATNVAIDRWTGGAAKGRLFSILQPWGVAFEPIVLRLDLARLATHGVPPAAAFYLLLLVLQEVIDGYAPIGFGTTRGFGDFEVKGVSFTAPAAVGDPLFARLNGREMRTSKGPASGGWSLLDAFAADPDLSGFREAWVEYARREPVVSQAEVSADG